MSPPSAPPWWAQGGEIVAAVSVSGPVGRTTRQPGSRYGAAVAAAAGAIAERLA